MRSKFWEAKTLAEKPKAKKEKKPTLDISKLSPAQLAALKTALGAP